MSDLYDDIFNDLASDSDPVVPQQAPVLAGGRVMTYLTDLPAPRREEQTLIDYAQTLPHVIAMRLLYTSYADEHVYTDATLQPLMENYFSVKLVGKTVKAVKRAINKLTGNFGPTLTDGNSNKAVMGFYELDDSMNLVERDDPPPFASVVVTPQDAQLARVVSSLAKIKVSLSAKTDEATTISNDAYLVPANTLDYPMEKKWIPLIAPLIAETNSKPVPVWELYKNYLSSKSPAIGMNIPYWSYRVNEKAWKRKYPTKPAPDLKTCLDTLSCPPWDRSAINGFMRNSVWFDGKLVPAHILLWNALWLLEIKSVVGNYPQKIVACAVQCDFYGLAGATPDPKGDATYNPTSSEAWPKQPADCYWNPSADIAGVITSSTIVLSANSYSQVSPVAAAWMQSNKRYSVTIVYGPNPHLFLSVHPEGLAKAPALRMVSILLQSVLWMPFFNLSHFVYDARSQDVWAIAYISSWVVFKTDKLKLYTYVPRVVANRINPAYTTATVAEFSSDVNEMSNDFHFFGESMDEEFKPAPTLTPPAKKQKVVEQQDEILAEVEESSEEEGEYEAE